MKKLITLCILAVSCLTLWSATVADSVPASQLTETEMIASIAEKTAMEMLTGDWQKGFSANEPYLSFNADGSYSITELSEAGYFVKTGRWMLADEGRTLLLHAADGDLLAFTIKYLELDEMVLAPVGDLEKTVFLNRL